MAMNEHDMLNDTELAALFEAAQESAPLPSQKLWDQVHQDALAALPPPRGVANVAPAQPGILAGIIAAIGGWPSLAGLVTATIAGVWIGFANPDALNDSTIAGLLPGFSATQGYDLDDFAPGFTGLSAILEEG